MIDMGDMNGLIIPVYEICQKSIINFIRYVWFSDARYVWLKVDDMYEHVYIR